MPCYIKHIVRNPRAKFEYFIEDEIESGIMLTGSEVKSIRNGQVSITDSYVHMKHNELFLYNCHIAQYTQANRLNHDTLRVKKILLHRGEIKKIIGKIKLKTYSLIPLSMYFNKKNIIKLELGLATGKKKHDKRQTIKEQDWQREQGRVMRDK